MLAKERYPVVLPQAQIALKKSSYVGEGQISGGFRVDAIRKDYRKDSECRISVQGKARGVVLQKVVLSDSPQVDC